MHSTPTKTPSKTVLFFYFDISRPKECSLKTARSTDLIYSLTIPVSQFAESAAAMRVLKEALKMLENERGRELRGGKAINNSEFTLIDQKPLRCDSLRA